MSILGVNDILAYAYQSVVSQYLDKTKKADAAGTNFIDQLGRTKEAAGASNFTSQLSKTKEAAGTSKSDAYQEYLKNRYGNVIIQAVGKDQRSIDAIGASTAGHNNVVIAPNILELMANDPKKAAYYEDKIQTGLADFPKVRAELSAAGFEIDSYGVYIDSDGIVHTYVSGDLKPEVRRKIEARMKAEDEAKAKRKKQYQERSEQAAKKRRLETETAYRQRSIAEMLAMKGGIGWL